MTVTRQAEIKEAILTVTDFPKAGIVFRDLTPLFQNPKLYFEVITEIGRRFSNCLWLGIESRGFIFAG